MLLSLGINNPSVATLLYMMGPHATCTNRVLVEAALKEFDIRKKQSQSKDVFKQVITNEEIKFLLQVNGMIIFYLLPSYLASVT